MRLTVPCRSTMTRRSSGTTSSAVIDHSARCCSAWVAYDHWLSRGPFANVSNRFAGSKTVFSAGCGGNVASSSG